MSEMGHFYKQEQEYTCGPACMRMILASKGINYSEKELEVLMETIPELSLNGGTKCAAFSKVAKMFNLDYVLGENSNIEMLKKLLNEKAIVVILFMQRSNIGDYGHFSIVRKISEDKIYLADPDEQDNFPMKLSEFLQEWYSESEDKTQWFFAVK